MSKRGEMHVDWMVSMGIFLLAVIALFIFLRPLDLKEVDKTDLLDTVIEGFNGNFMWEVKSFPIFIKTCQSVSNSFPPPNFFTSSIDINILPGSFWDIGRVRYLDDNADIKINLAPSVIQCDVDPLIPGDEDILNNHLRVVESEKARLIVTYYSDFIDPDRAEIDIVCNAADGDPSNCEISVGAHETVDGINEDWLGLIANDPYFDIANIKSNWGLPSNSNFWIESEDFDLDGDGSVDLLDYFTEKPFNQTDVVSREIKTFKVDNEGTIEQVSIIFRVW